MSNGSRLVEGADQRSTWVRRLRDLINAHISDLGGADAVSEAEKSIVRRAATLTVELERLEAKFAINGEAAKGDLDLYGRTAGNLRRLLSTLGLKRVAREVPPTLATYAAARAAEKAAAARREAVDAEASA